MPEMTVVRYANTRRRSHMVKFRKANNAQGYSGGMWSQERCNLDDAKKYTITEEPEKQKCLHCTSGKRFPV